MSWVAIDDLLGAIHYAMMTETLAGPVNVTAPHPVTNRAFAAMLGKVLDRPALVSVPALALRLAFGEMADAAVLASARVLPARLEESGYHFRYPDLEGAFRYLLGRPARPDRARDHSLPRTPYLTRMTLPKAVLLLSGGVDSTTTAAIALHEGFDVHALSVRYGQRHAVELEAARRVAERLGIRRHVIVDLDLRAFGGSALTADVAVPKDTPLAEIGARIPATYVPARNTIFLPSRWPGPKPWARATSSSAPTRSTTAATPIAAPSTSRRSLGWRTWPPAPVSRTGSGSGSTRRCCG